MITFENPQVGNRISLSDLTAPKCSNLNDTHGFCLHLEFYGKDLGMRNKFNAAVFQMRQGSQVKKKPTRSVHDPIN